MEKTYLQQVGERLYKSRTADCYSRKELANRAGVSIQTIRVMERGEKAVDIEDAYKICNVLNCSIEYILSGNCGLTEILKINEKFVNLSNVNMEHLDKLIKAFWETRPKSMR